MAHSSVPDLPAAGALTGEELIHIVQAGNSRKAPLSDLAPLATGLLGSRNWAVPFRGAFVRRAAALTASFPLFWSWDTILYDTDGFFTSAQRSRFTIPEGVKKIRLLGQASLGGSSTASGYFLTIYKNGGVDPACPKINMRQYSSGYADNTMFVVSAVIDVEPGDYFELRSNCGSSLSAIADIPEDCGAWFAVEVIESIDTVSLPYDSKVLALGSVAASSVIDLDVAPRSYRLAEDAAGSQFYADTAPSGGAAVFDIQKNGVTVGTLTFADGANTGVYAGAQTDFAAGDVRKIVAPSSPNGIADLAANLRLEAL